LKQVEKVDIVCNYLTKGTHLTSINTHVANLTHFCRSMPGSVRLCPFRIPQAKFTESRAMIMTRGAFASLRGYCCQTMQVLMIKRWPFLVL